jgi:4-hydroxybenzoate polyprenyltransferase
MMACVGAFFVGFIVLARENIYLAPLFPFVTGYVYSKGISVARFSLKLKGGVGRKNAVIGLTWGGSIALIVSHYNHDLCTLAAIFLFFGLKLFINSTLFDFKDVEGDFLAGIRTLPICMGEKLTKYLLITVCIVLHAIMVAAIVFGKIQSEIIILATSLIFGLTFIAIYSITFDKNAKGLKKNFRVVMVAGESPVALILRSGFRAFVA